MASELLEREMERIELRPFTLEGFHQRRHRRERNRRIRAGVVALAVAAAGIGTLVRVFSSETIPADRPTPSVLRRNGEILRFTGFSPGARTPGDLVAVDPETGEERVLVEDLDFVYNASWSADGRWVAYEAAGPTGIGLWVVSGAQEPRQVVEPGASIPTILDWSPTGAELAIVHLRTFDPATGETTDAQELFAKGIGVVHSIEGSTLSTIDPATGETTDVGPVPGSAEVTEWPVWSPDGSRFVYGTRGGALYSIDARSGARSLLARLPGEERGVVGKIAWSPDGAYLAVGTDRETASGRLYVLNADGSNVRVLVDEFGDSDAEWAPDGNRLAYGDGSRVWVATMDGSAPTAIGRLPAAPGELLDRDLTWSPDGSRIAVRTTGEGGSVVSAMNADGSGDAEPIGELTFESWSGGRYRCSCS